MDDPNLKKFDEHDKFIQDKDRLLTRRFFKFLGNFKGADQAKLCQHILYNFNPSQRWRHPKVVIK